LPERPIIGVRVMFLQGDRQEKTELLQCGLKMGRHA